MNYQQMEFSEKAKLFCSRIPKVSNAEAADGLKDVQCMLHGWEQMWLDDMEEGDKCYESVLNDLQADLESICNYPDEHSISVLFAATVMYCMIDHYQDIYDTELAYNNLKLFLKNLIKAFDGA